MLFWHTQESRFIDPGRRQPVLSNYRSQSPVRESSLDVIMAIDTLSHHGKEQIARGKCPGINGIPSYHSITGDIAFEAQQICNLAQAQVHSSSLPLTEPPNLRA